jgi:hypothetical protein
MLQALSEREDVSGADVVRRLIRKHCEETFDASETIELPGGAVYVVRRAAEIDIIRPRDARLVVRFHKRDTRDMWRREWLGVPGELATQAAEVLGLKVRN